MPFSDVRCLPNFIWMFIKKYSNIEGGLIKLTQNMKTTKENAVSTLFKEHFVTEYGYVARNPFTAHMMPLSKCDT